MKTSAELMQLRSSKITDQQNLVDVAKNEVREMSSDENTTFDGLQADIESLDTQITRAEKFEANAKRNAAPVDMAVREGLSDKDNKDLEGFSFTKFLREAGTKTLTGVEKEMSEQASDEMRNSGKTIEGAGLPVDFVKRNMSAGVAAEGGNTIATELETIIELLRPTLQTEDLGAQVFRGLVGDVDFPTHATGSSAAWEGENDANAQSDATFGKISMTPNRVGALSVVSKQLLAQSSVDISSFVASDLGMATAIAIDAAAINGSGSSNQPTGILNTTGIGDVAGGTNGLLPTWANIVELESDIAAGNAVAENLAYLTTPGMRGALKGVAKDAGSGLFVWDGAVMNGYDARVSSQVPSDLTKGTSSDCHAILFGNWSELLIGYWGAIDLVVDPYTAAGTSQVKIYINEFVDVAVRHAASFAAMKDGLTA